MPDVTVVTLTRRRSPLVVRALATVEQQQTTADVEHLILVDACDDTMAALERTSLPRSARAQLMPREPWEVSGPGRSSRLRNYGVRTSGAQWIAFLDDDNEWKPDHLQTLLECASASGCRAVHSHMELLYPDGLPYIEERFPWCRDPDEGRAMFDEMCRRGIFGCGSNVVRDRADPLSHPDPIRTVDTGEWLLARDLLLEIPFRDDCTAVDELEVISEDDKLVTDLVNARVPIACTQKATLRYYLGGYSNNFDVRFDESFAWC